MLRQIWRVPAAGAIFVGLVIFCGGTISLLNSKVSAWAKHQSSTVHYGTVAIVFIVSLIMAVWVFKAIYLAAVDLFRADDAHPLLAPVASTIVAWALAVQVLAAGGPAGVPHDVAVWLEFLGPMTVTAINALACFRLWRKYHSLLFRNGPLGIDPRPDTDQRGLGSVAVGGSW
jgi:hypothetical protein